MTGELLVEVERKRHLRRTRLGRELLERHLIGEVERADDGHDSVVTVRQPIQDPQQQIQFRGRTQYHGSSVPARAAVMDKHLADAIMNCNFTEHPVVPHAVANCGWQVCARGLGRAGLAPLFFESALRRLPPAGSPLLVHFVCQGNILRSAYAAARLTSLLPPSSPVVVSSSGTLTDNGKPADPLGREVAKKRGVLLDDHRTSVIDPAELERAWIIATMDRLVHLNVYRRFPAARGKLLLLGSLLLGEGGGPFIADPYGKPAETIEAAFALIDRALEKLVQRLPAPPEPPPR
jgi:protein-tyrosine-phosphatase